VKQWIKEPTPGDLIHYNFSKEAIKEDWLSISFYDVQAYRKCWYYRNKSIPFELITYNEAAKSCYIKQNPYFNIYAYALKIEPEDPEYALSMRLEDCVDQALTFAQGVFDLWSPVWKDGVTYLSSTLKLPYKDSLYWLKVLTCVYCVRYGFPISTDDNRAVDDKALAVRVYPVSSLFWGEVPPAFNEIVRGVFPLEGLDFRDKLDEITYEAVSFVGIAKFFEFNRQRIEDHNNHKRAQILLVGALIGGALLAPTIIIAYQAAMSAALSPSLSTLSTLSKIKLGVEVFVGSLQTSISALLTAIHFDTLVSVHKIAWLVSDDYRAIMRGVYSEIVSVSQALGYGPYFMVLFLQNARNLVLDVSTSLGMKYDLAQVEWLSVSQGYLKSFSAATYRYSSNPEALLYDLERWVERPVMDQKGSFIQGVIMTVERTTKAVEDIVTDVVVIRDDIDKLVSDLPDRIRLQVEPYVTPYIEKFDTFITETYDPYKDSLDSIMEGITSLQGRQREEMTGLIDRLKKPADYLLEIDRFSDEDRFDQERKFSDISTRQYYRDVKGFTPLSEPASAELKKIREALMVAIPMPIGFPEEIEGPVRPAGIKAAPRKTWFVGDY